jgi:hypothetical protein
MYWLMGVYPTFSANTLWEYSPYLTFLIIRCIDRYKVLLKITSLLKKEVYVSREWILATVKCCTKLTVGSSDFRPTVAWPDCSVVASIYLVKCQILVYISKGIIIISVSTPWVYFLPPRHRQGLERETKTRPHASLCLWPARIGNHAWLVRCDGLAVSHSCVPPLIHFSHAFSHCTTLVTNHLLLLLWGGLFAVLLQLCPCSCFQYFVLLFTVKPLYKGHTWTPWKSTQRCLNVQQY